MITINEGMPLNKARSFEVELPKDTKILAPEVDRKEQWFVFKSTCDTIAKETEIRYFAYLNINDIPSDAVILNEVDGEWLVELADSTRYCALQTDCFRVQRYELYCEHNRIEMPVGSRVMEVGLDEYQDDICLWCLVDTRVKEVEIRKFDLYLTDEMIIGHGTYIGTVNLNGKIFHVIEAEQN